MSKHEIKTSYKMIKNVVKILELLGDRLEVCVSVSYPIHIGDRSVINDSQHLSSITFSPKSECIKCLKSV